MAYVAEKRLYVNADRSKVVEEDAEDAAFLLVGEGGQLSDDEAKRYGLTHKPEAESKAVEHAPSNKAQHQASKK